MQDKIVPLQIQIQLATSDNLESIVSIIRQTAKWLKTKGIKQWNENFPLSRLEEELLNGELFVVVDPSQKVIGTLSLSQRQAELWPDSENLTATYINRLAIFREYAGRNLGLAIINWAKEYAKQRDVGLLRLNCDKTNPFLPSFYQGCGFHCVGEFFYSPWQMTFLLLEMKIS